MTEPSERDLTIPLHEERVEIAKRDVERGRVAVHIRTEQREELVSARLRRDEVTVERVPVGRVVEAPPPVREEDGVLIVPLLEERLIVRTELVLTEELRIVRRSRTEEVQEPVTLRSERAEVARSEGQAQQPDRPE